MWPRSLWRSYSARGRGKSAFHVAPFQGVKRQPLGGGRRSGMLRQAMEPSCFGLAGGRAQQTGQDHVQWIEAIARLSRWFAPGQ